MKISQMIQVALITTALILFFLWILSIVLVILKKKKLNIFLQKKKKNKKRFKKRRAQLERKVRKQRNQVILLSILEIVVLSGLFGFIYYQTINVASLDSDSIVRGYFLVDDFSKEIEKASVSEDEESSKQNIKYLALSMATYSNKQADTSNTKEGQRLINKYYSMVGQLGMNATRDMNSFYGNKNNVLESYKAELARVKDSENKAFEFYKINANSLENGAKEKD